MSIPLSEFEKTCADNRLRIVERKNLSQGVDALIAQGYRTADHHMPENHWVVCWLLTRDENVLEGQTLRIPSYVTMPASNIPIATSQEDRVDIAMEAAVKWLNNSKKAGWA